MKLITLSEPQIAHCLEMIATPANVQQLHCAKMAVMAHFKQTAECIAELETRLAVVKAKGGKE